MEFVTRRPIVLEVYRSVSLRFFDFIFDLKFSNRFGGKRVSKVSFICELFCLRINQEQEDKNLQKKRRRKDHLNFSFIHSKKGNALRRSKPSHKRRNNSPRNLKRSTWLSLSLKIPWNPISRRVNSSLPRTGHERETSYWVQRERGRKREWIRVSTRNRFPRMDHGGVPSVLEGTGAPLPAENTSFLLFIFTNTSPGKGDGSLDGSVMCALYFHSLE